MSISAAMIVRNEAHNLPACIRSLVGQVDEIVLLDTGSTDGTLNLDWLARLPAPITLVTFAWCDDFAAARNEALGYCQGDWILVVDADDRLQGDLRTLTDEAPADTIAFPVNTISHWPDGRSTLSADHCRLWRRQYANGEPTGIHYRRRVHELPYLPDGSDVPMTPQMDVTLLHFGYDLSPADLERKRERNRRLVMLGLADEPENPRYWFDAARVALGVGDAQDALDRCAMSLQLWNQQDCPPREFVTYCLDVALQCAAKLAQPDTGQRCWNSVPYAFRGPQTPYLFARMLAG